LFANSLVILSLKVNLTSKAQEILMSIYSKSIIAITLLIAATASVQANETMQKKAGGHQRPSFESIDANADGDIDFDEFSLQELPHGDHQTVFTSIDTDNNGVLSEDEFDNHKPPHPKHGKGRPHD
jgi:hypothetical protein